MYTIYLYPTITHATIGSYSKYNRLDLMYNSRGPAYIVLSFAILDVINCRYSFLRQVKWQDVAVCQL